MSAAAVTAAIAAADHNTEHSKYDHSAGNPSWEKIEALLIGSWTT